MEEIMKKVNRMSDDASSIINEYQERMTEVFAKEGKKIIQEAQEEATSIITKARDEADCIAKEARSEVMKEKQRFEIESRQKAVNDAEKLMAAESEIASDIPITQPICLAISFACVSE